MDVTPESPATNMTMHCDHDPYEHGDGSDGNPCSDCDETDVHGECDDCGTPLCYVCHELGAGFCKECPSSTYGQRVGLA